MNCRDAQRQLSAARDGAPATPGGAELAAHVAGCKACGTFSISLADTSEGLRRAAARVTVPDEERAWQDIRREIRAAPAKRSAWRQTVRWALPLGATAALAAVIALVPRGGEDVALPAAAAPAVARAEFVEVAGDASSVVYVDDKSGWLVVWAAPVAKAE